ncbi:MAG: tetratricopeptide repeat protein, partial [Myxococcales bacterium]|nr:tetratricopeptide repeat protein [Myxococcales bacterium]
MALHGCTAIATGSGPVRCLLSKPKPLALWIGTRKHPSTVSVTLDGTPIDAAITGSPTGLLVKVEPAVDRGLLLLQDPEGQRWSVALEPLSPNYQAARKQAVAEARAGENARAQETLTLALAVQHPPPEALLLRCVAAQIAYSSGDLDAVLAAPGEIEALLGESPLRPVSCIAEAHMQAAFVLLDQRPDFDVAEAHIAAAEAEQAHDLQAQIGTLYLRGVLEHRLGRVDESLRAFEASAALADRFDAPQRFAAARVMQAVALARLGRFAEAEAIA